MDNKSVAEGICKLLDNSHTRQKLIEYCKNNSFGNKDEFRKIENLNKI